MPYNLHRPIQAAHANARWPPLDPCKTHLCRALRQLFVSYTVALLNIELVGAIIVGGRIKEVPTIIRAFPHRSKYQVVQESALLLYCKFHLQGMLTPKLLCCESGMVDKCGVCDGDGTSCPTISTVQFKPLTPTSASRRLTRADTHRDTDSFVPVVARNATTRAQPGRDRMSAGTTGQLALSENSGGLANAYGSRRLQDASLNEAIERFKHCMCTSLLWGRQ
jgi:hypothetical protein